MVSTTVPGSDTASVFCLAEGWTLRFPVSRVVKCESDGSERGTVPLKFLGESDAVSPVRLCFMLPIRTFGDPSAKPWIPVSTPPWQTAA